MDAKSFLKILNTDFITGVPDSLLKPFTDCIINEFEGKHIVAANEGNASALAAGYYISKRKIPVVYMQNSGIGNIINPVCSLLNEEIYGIPVIFIVGYRGEPGIKDEPQHIFQGKITELLLNDVGIKTFTLCNDTTESELSDFLTNNICPSSNSSVAIIVKKDAISYDKKINFSNAFSLEREKAIEIISKATNGDYILSTTGKISRELFEIRENNSQSHSRDFLNVGSMGHCSSIALSVAINNPSKRIWCIDGDGAVIMHMGAMATIGDLAPNNFIHIVLNNNAHDTVGGMHNSSEKIDLCKVAAACGYKNVFSADNSQELINILEKLKVTDKLSFLEVKVKQGARNNLIRPTISPKDNLNNFTNELIHNNSSVKFTHCEERL